ncbi:class C sortase [Enterococcus camelliae]
MVGILLFLYPFYINALNTFIDQARVASIQKEEKVAYQAKRAALAKENKRIQERGLNPSAVNFDTDGTNVSQSYYKKHLIGNVTIPSIKVAIPLFDTTNDSLLQLGATVVQGTSYPTGEVNNHSVIAAHSGISNRELFSNLEAVKLGDQFVVTVFGKKMAYQVDRINVVKPDDTSSLKIEANRDLVTLLTCTPYMINTDRLLVTGHRVPYTEKLAQKIKHSQASSNAKQWAILIGTMALLLVMTVVFFKIWYIYLLKRKTMTIVLRIETSVGKPVVGCAFALFNKRGTKQFKRKGAPFVAKADHAGVVAFEAIPRGVYQIKEQIDVKMKPVGIIGIKRLKENQPALYRQFTTEIRQNENAEFLIVVDRNHIR